MSRFLRLFLILFSYSSLYFFLNPSLNSAILFIIITLIIRQLFKKRSMTSHINYEVLINLRRIEVFCLRHSTFYQLRVSVYQVDQKNNSIFAIPFMMLKIEKEANSKQLKPFQNSNDSEIDHQNHAFLTRRMIIRNMDDSIDVNQICVFKGNFLIGKQGNINKQIRIYVQLLSYQQNQVEVLEQWIGTTLQSYGNSYCPMYFNSYRFTCNLHSTIHLMASSEIERLPSIASFTKQNGRNIQYFKFCSENIQNSIQSMKQLIKTLNKNLQSQQNATKDIYKLNPSTYRYDLFSKKPIINQLTNLQTSEIEIEINKLSQKQLLQKTKDSLYLLNQVAFDYWKKIQLILTTKLNQSDIKNMKKVYTDQLQQFHESNNFLIEQENKPFKSIKSSLMIYPFEQHDTYLKLKKKDMDAILSCKKSSKTQLYVFVHGYQASSFDMEPISNYLRFKNPNIIVLLSNVNEGKTQQPIEQSAHRLAIEIKNFINSLQLKDFEINMVCHSLGGVIGRACLKYLQLHKDKFNYFISLCSPHLGYLYHSSTLISTSLWILNKVKKDPSMIELTLSDSEDLNKTFICDASKRKELNWFNKIWLFGSKEDQYVPYWSAILEDKSFFFETESSKVYKNMLENLTKEIEEKIIRCQIIFNQKTKDLSNFIGRTAHIKILNFIPGLALATSILPV